MEAPNILMKAVRKLNDQFIKKYSNIKSANSKNQLSDNYMKNNIGSKLIKTISKKI